MGISYPGDGCIWRFRRCLKEENHEYYRNASRNFVHFDYFHSNVNLWYLCTKARIRYMTYTNELRRHGKYVEWSNKNKIALFSENFSIYAFIVSFFGFMITGVLRLEDIAKFFFICFIVFSLSGVISSSILDRKIPKE